MRSRAQGAALALLAFLGLLPAQPSEARTLRWARSIDATTLDPHSSNTGPNILLAHQIYEPLIVRQMDGWMVPALALSWALVGPAVWEFKLRPGVTFHDGSAFNADDVVFSLERARAEASDVKSLLSSVESVSRVDDLTVRIGTRGPDPLLPNNLTDVFVMDREWSQAKGVATPQDVRRTEETFATRNSNGTGPYRLETREPEVRTVLRRNDVYWGRGEVPLDISEIVYLPIRDSAARVSALLAGEVDFVQDVPVGDIAALEMARGVRVKSGPENRSIFLGLDVGSRELRTAGLKGSNPFADRRVREAMTIAIDRDAIRRGAMRGQSVPAGIILPPSSNGYTRELDAVPPLDRERARTLLAEAGYADGFGVQLHCTNDRYVGDEAVCRAVADMLRQVGVRAEPIGQPASRHFGQVRRAELDFYLLGWGVTTFDSEYVFDFLYHTNTGQHGGWNGTRYSDPEVDARIRSLRGEIDANRRNRTIAELWRKLKTEVIYIPLHNQNVTHAMREEFDIPTDVSNQPKMKYVSVRPM